MALWEITINKELGDEQWTNVYWVEADTLQLASAEGFQIFSYERAVHYTQVYFRSYRVSDGQPGTDVFVIVPLGTNGLKVPTGDLLPLFNTIRVDFGTAIGRPSRKYLRGCLTEADIQFTTINGGGLAAAIEYSVNMFELESYKDVDGQDIISGTASPVVQMRQLRRGSKRRIPTP
jgi:hypothetical protein